MEQLLRRLPKVDQLLDEPEVKELAETIPRRLVLQAVRDILESFRARILAGDAQIGPDDLARPRLAALIRSEAQRLARPSFRRVVNGAGVVIHTNLGRSLMAEEALEAIAAAGRYYSNLEFDLQTGRRGSRYSHVEALLCDLTGAEAALVVNNNAAAVLLALETLARGREVIVSRGELVEIGGSFRIPEVMAKSGAVLVEVGATNKTHYHDYERAITEQTALLLKVHQSNFRMIGFTSLVDAVELSELGRKHGLPVMEDLGSGSLVDFSRFGLAKEPTVQETVKSGVDVTTFSGDKLLGGPQAGLILGRKDIVARIKKNPLNRALRIDKFTLAALEATLRLYLDEPRALTGVPTLNLIARPYPELRRQAARLRRKLVQVAPDWIRVGEADGCSQIGGGALPAQELKTRLVTLSPARLSVNELETALLNMPVPVIGRIENDLFVLDVRTIAAADHRLIAQALADLAAERPA